MTLEKPDSLHFGFDEYNEFEECRTIVLTCNGRETRWYMEGFPGEEDRWNEHWMIYSKCAPEEMYGNPPQECYTSLTGDESVARNKIVECCLRDFDDVSAMSPWLHPQTGRAQWKEGAQ